MPGETAAGWRPRLLGCAVSRRDSWQLTAHLSVLVELPAAGRYTCLLRRRFRPILTTNRFQAAGQASQGADRTGLLAVEWRRMHFEIVGEISEIQTVATGRGIRRLKFLRRRYGGRLWRKQKGVATVRLSGGSLRRAELHWYEAHGVGRTGWKIKRFLD